MPLAAGCPRCATPLVPDAAGGWTCPAHGPVAPLWRPGTASYDDFAEHLETAGRFPTYLPWPMSPGWSVSDFGVVGGRAEPARATMTCCSGTSQLDGPVDVLVVAEEAGTGLGARCAGLPGDGPATDLRTEAPVKVHLDARSVPLWAVSTSAFQHAATGRCWPVRPPGAGSGWWSARRRRCCCCATTGSCATSPMPDRRWSRCLSVARRPAGDDGAPDYGGHRAHRPPHPLAGQSTARRRRPSWCAPARRPGWTSSRSPTTTRPTAGPRPSGPPREFGIGWCGAWRSAPCSTAAPCTCSPTCPTRRTRRWPPSSPDPRRPQLPAARDAGAAARARHRHRRGRRTPAAPATPPRPGGRTSPTPWSPWASSRDRDEAFERSSTPAGPAYVDRYAPPLDAMIGPSPRPAARR